MSSPVVHSFAPIARSDATVLVLGSMPGQASLDAQQYYAHPRNAFWPIMAALFKIDATAAYVARCRSLIDSGVAVWDVLQACERPGSLDASIVEDTIVANDFDRFFVEHPGIQHVAFNGAKAQTAYRKYVLKQLDEPFTKLTMTRLPSTSPAHASMSMTEKLDCWRAIRQSVR